MFEVRIAIILMNFTSLLRLSPLGPYHSLMYGRSLYFDISKIQVEMVVCIAQICGVRRQCDLVFAELSAPEAESGFQRSFFVKLQQKACSYDP